MRVYQKRIIASFDENGALVRRSRRDAWVGAFAEALSPQRGPAPVMGRGQATAIGWKRTGQALAKAADKVRGK